MRKKNTNVNMRKLISTLLVLNCIYVMGFSVHVHAREAENEDGSSNQQESRTNSYQKILKSNEESINKVLELFNSDIGEYETVPTATQEPQEVYPTSPPHYRPLLQGMSLSKIIEQIAEVVYRNCTMFGTGVVKVQNSYCVDPVRNLFSDARGAGVVRDLKDSANRYYNLQCVGCAVAMSNLNSTYYRGVGHAKQHVKKVNGYTYYSSSSPDTARRVVPGSLFVMTGGTYGHIGMVIDTNRDTRGNVVSYRTQECNVRAPGHFEYGRNRTIGEVTGFQIPI